MTSVCDSERLAAAYAFDRPSVHGQILRSARLSRQVGRALDVGCGAGLSTAALAPLARHAAVGTSTSASPEGRRTLHSTSTASSTEGRRVLLSHAPPTAA